jgi:hypothetical protein
MVANSENAYLGTATNGGMRIWKSMHIEYIIGALVAVTLKLSNTIRNLLNFADRGENCLDESTDIAISIDCIPVRNRRGRYCCGSAEALEGDL